MLSDTIKRLRLENGWTQSELGEKIGVKKAAVQKYESGLVKNLKQETIQKLADAFGMSTGMFIAISNEEQIRKEVILIDEIKLSYGDEAAELLNLFSELNDVNKEKVIEYATDIHIVESVKA